MKEEERKRREGERQRYSRDKTKKLGVKYEAVSKMSVVEYC